MVQALNEMGIPIDGYVGSSAGALVAALFAQGYTPKHLKQLALSLKPRDFRVAWGQIVKGLVQGRLPTALLRADTWWNRVGVPMQEMSWEDLCCPLWVVTTSLTRRQAVVFGSRPPVSESWGDRQHLAWEGRKLTLAQSLKASSAVPGLVSPIPFESQWLVDGGVADDYPVDVAAWVGATDIVGLWVDEHPLWQSPKRVHMGHFLMGSLTTMIRELSIVRQRQVTVPRVDIRVEIEDGHRVFHRVPEIIHMGYRFTWAQASSIKEALRGA